jgi:hypothetical protein
VFILCSYQAAKLLGKFATIQVVPRSSPTSTMTR